MLELMRAWDIAQEDVIMVRPKDPLAKAVEKLLERRRQGRPPYCALVVDDHGRYLGTLSTHRALRAIGQNLEKQGVFSPSPHLDSDKATRAVCRMVGTQTVEKHMYTKSLQISPQTTVPELLRLFSDNTGHFAVLVEAGRALGIVELDDIFNLLAPEMVEEM